MSKTKTPIEPLRVVCSGSIPLRVGVSKPDGVRYVVEFPVGVPLLLVGDAECRAVDQHVINGQLRELEMPERLQDELLQQLVEKQAAKQIAELRERIILLEQHIDQLTSQEAAHA